MEPIEARAVVLGVAVHYQTVIEDPFLAEYLQSMPLDLRVPSLDAALLMGARFQATQRTESNVIALTDQMHAATRNVGEQLGATLAGIEKSIKLLADGYLSEDGKLAQRMNAIAQDFDKTLDPDKSEAIRALRERIQRDVLKPVQTVLEEMKRVANLNDENSALGVMHKGISDLRQQIAELHVKLDAQATLAQAKRRTPHVAGTSLEDFVSSVIAPIAGAAGEELDDVRAVDGEVNRSKAGDYVTNVDRAFTRGLPARLAIEAKNRQSFTVSRLTRELDEAMGNRGATAAMGVLTNAKAAPDMGFNVYGSNKVIVFLPGFGTPGFDSDLATVFVRAGYCVARVLAIANVEGVDVDSIDIEQLTAIRDELNALGGLCTQIADNHTRVHSAVNEAEGTAAQMKTLLNGVIRKLQDVVNVQIARLSETGESEAA